MNRYYVVNLMVIVFSCLVAVTASGENKNLLKNPGFEEIAPFVVSDKYKEKVEATEMPKEWSMSFTYFGKLVVICDPETSHGGINYIKLKKEGKTYVVLIEAGKYSPAHPRKCRTGEKYSASIWAKGEGKLWILAYMYQEHRGFKFSRGSSSLEISSNEWKEYKVEFTIPEQITGFILSWHVNGTIDIDDACLSLMKTD